MIEPPAVPTSLTSPSVFLVDDDPGVLKGLSRLLRSASFAVVTFGSPEEFLHQVEPRASGCLVLDYTMPGLNGLELQEALQRRGSLLPIIFLTANGDVPTSVLAMKRGAVDFLTKPVRDTDLLAAVEAAIQQNQRLLADLTERDEFLARVASLTAREHEVFLQVVAGRLNKQIASDIGTVEQTVKVHRARVMEKMRVESVAELARIAERLGIAPQLTSRPNPGDSSPPVAR